MKSAFDRPGLRRHPSFAGLLAICLLLSPAVSSDGHASPGEVLGQAKISDTEGGFTDPLDPFGWWGSACASLGDLDGDGVTDIAVGAYKFDDGGPERGSMWILFLEPDGSVKAHQRISSTAGNFTGTLEDYNRWGYGFAPLDDFDGDGVLDLAVSQYHSDDGGSNRGAIWFLYLNPDGTVKSHTKISDTEGNFQGILHDEDRFGAGLAFLGDLDGDGVGDLAASTPNDDYGAIFNYNYGSVWILFLEADGTVKSYQKISANGDGNFTGILDKGDLFGVSIANLGDLDRDGVVDIAVGAQHDDDGAFDAGAVWILFLNTDGTVKAHQKISETEGGFTGDLDERDFFGRDEMAAVGDIDGDGRMDLAVAAYRDDDGGLDHGAMWVLFLNDDGTVKGHQKISSTDGNFEGPLDVNDMFGSGAAPLGDFDGDGKLDMVVGARLDDDGGMDQGAVYILRLDGVQQTDVSDAGHAAPGLDLRITGQNPVRDAAGSRFSFRIPAGDADVLVGMYDLSGRRVATLVDERLGPGYHVRDIGESTLRPLGSGVYFLRMSAGAFDDSERLVLVK